MNKFAALMLIFFFINSLFVAVFSSASASELASDSWSTKVPMRQARYDLDVVAVDDKIYAIGGDISTINNLSRSFDSY